MCQPYGMSPEDAERLRIIQSTYQDLDRWFGRQKIQPESPQNGSELHEDDKVFPAHKISEVARLSLALSVEHMRLIRVVLDKRELFPSAPLTTLRGALVGAAQAVWIISPDDRETRQKRGLCVIAEEYAQLGKFYREVDRLDPGKVPASQWDWLNQRIAAVAALRGPKAFELNQTDMIGAALDTAFPNSPDKQINGRLLWRHMSCDAHVLGWAVSQRATVQTRRADGSDLAVLVAGGELEHLADPFMCAYQLARAGWSLFDRRCDAG
jgi:hypothetical protein